MARITPSACISSVGYGEVEERRGVPIARHEDGLTEGEGKRPGARLEHLLLGALAPCEKSVDEAPPRQEEQRPYEVRVMHTNPSLREE